MSSPSMPETPRVNAVASGRPDAVRRTAGLALACAAVAVLLGIASSTPARAQENAMQEAARRSAALSSLPKDAARRLFGTVTSAAPAGEPRIAGEYWKGCYSGGMQFPATGEGWQVMRLSRNRNWGHPVLITFLQRFVKKAAEVTGWPGLLIGDMSQPRGGPMLTGHASHQLGIEADVWLRPMPDRRLSLEEVEEMLSTDLLRPDGKDVDPKIYTPQHLALLRAAAQETDVARVFVNAGIKKALCRDAGTDRRWLSKIRPAPGHTYHFHIRLACPAEQAGCIDQTPPLDGDGCGKELNSWFIPSQPPKPGAGRALSVKAMPKMCQSLVGAPATMDGQETHARLQ